MAQAYLAYRCDRFDVRGKEHLRTNGKYYAVESLVYQCWDDEEVRPRDVGEGPVELTSGLDPGEVQDKRRVPPISSTGPWVVRMASLG